MLNKIDLNAIKLKTYQDSIIVVIQSISHVLLFLQRYKLLVKKSRLRLKRLSRVLFLE